MPNFLRDIPGSFRTFTDVPNILYDIPVDQLFTYLKKPSVIKIPGAKSPPMFISSLLHGSEHTGIVAMQALLKKYRENDQQWPRTVYWLIGNVESAAQNKRYLDGQPDFNRIWLGGDSPIASAAQKLVEVVAKQGFFASIDIHNNTGKNPFYGCISDLHPDHCSLASIFSNKIVYFKKPESAQSVVFSKYFPAITVECGLSKNAPATEHCANYLETIMHLDQFPRPRSADMDIFETIARIRLPYDASIEFCENGSSDFNFKRDLDTLNFVLMEKGFVIGTTTRPDDLVIENICGNQKKLIDIIDGKMTLLEDLVPSMFTEDKKVIHQDCLGYLMRKVKNLSYNA